MKIGKEINIVKYKLIASDLDETLLNDQKHVGIKTQEAIKELKNKGIRFVPNAGRGYTLIRQTLKEIDALDQPDSYVISFNGSVITENKNERIIDQTLLDFSIINQLFKIGVKQRVPIHIYTMDDIYVCNLNDSEKGYLDRMGFTYNVFAGESIDFLKKQQLVKIIYMSKVQTVLDNIYSQIPKSLLQETTVTHSSNRYMEFNHVGINKGKGLLKLAKLLNIKPSEIIAVGDNSNDLAMIRAAGLGVAVKNAVPEVKEAADFVLTHDYNHDAIAELIERFT